MFGILSRDGHKKGKPVKERSQSTMEYLMTYGWAILLVLIVWAILFELGILGSLFDSFACLGRPGFICQNVTMSSGGAVTVTLGFVGSQPITITGLGCNVTAPKKGPSYETQNIVVQPQQTVTLVFQCPVSGASIGTSIPIYLWIDYDMPSISGLTQPYAQGVLKVSYHSSQWSVTEWKVSDSSVQLLPFSSVSANPATPLGTTAIANTVWSTATINNAEGWSYSTDWHVSDVYNGMQTVVFPITPLGLDLVNCGGPPFNSLGYTATTTAYMSGAYTISTWTDDGTEIFYKNTQGGAWSSVFSGSAWKPQAPTFYSNKITFPSGTYQLAIDYIDTCDPAGLSAVIFSPVLK